ncbi:metallo-beta-lactamase domain protein [delta proteobacterium NaphS2]|nr:metallo-beta-lactamase domain protein [delta proteobacterium NaphS2]
MKIVHLGGEKTVTGSCHLLQVNGLNILVDCGLAQGRDHLLPMDCWPVKPADVDFLFLTHAHIDHVGRVPELVQKGFRGEILTTHATKALLEPMLKDAAGFSHLTELESVGLLTVIDRLSWGFEYGQSFDLDRGVRFTLGRAGHILGSCWIQLDLSGEGRVVFSGDLGAEHTPLLCDPDVPEGCDVLVMEATYGDRVHGDRKDRKMRLGQVLQKALADGGKVLIPAFALGRTQELLYEMDRVFGKGDFRVPVFLDSPLGLEITKVYSSLSQYWDQEARGHLSRGDHPIDFDGLYAVRRHSDHMDLQRTDGPMVILAGSGMCTGGRIVNHIREGIEKPENDMLFVGYQVPGTPGRDILTYCGKPGGYVMLEGERLAIRAGVHLMAGYSAHADRNGLVAWVNAMVGRPRIKLVHGDGQARRALGEALELGIRRDG